jgi:NhaA family Na+:H+ antiporter
MVGLNLAGVRRGWPFALLAVALWFCVLRSGIHPTVAGVLGAFAVPLARGGRGHKHGGRSPLLRMEALLAPWSAYVIVPLFGLANAGVAVAAGAWSGRLVLAVAAGLVLGKQAGIFGAVLLAEWLGLGTRPRGASGMQLWGVSLLGGIGFTMSLLLATLAFPANAFPNAPALVAQAKLGILAGSLASAVLGFAVLWWAGRKRPLG